MRAQLTAIKRAAKNDPDLGRFKAMTVVQNMKDDSETKLLKKLVTNWMAEAEPKDEALD